MNNEQQTKTAPEKLSEGYGESSRNIWLLTLRSVILLLFFKVLASIITVEETSSFAVGCCSRLLVFNAWVRLGHFEVPIPKLGRRRVSGRGKPRDLASNGLLVLFGQSMGTASMRRPCSWNLDGNVNRKRPEHLSVYVMVMTTHFHASRYSSNSVLNLNTRVEKYNLCSHRNA